MPRSHADTTGADTVPFPLVRRVGKIRRVADLIVRSISDRAAAHHWNRSIDDLTRQMERAGIPDGRIETELATFRAAVEAEVARLRHAGNQGRGGAA